MPRPPRLHVPGGFYHVIMRGNHRQDLFAHATDRHILNEIVCHALERCNARMHAFCWMSNHLHALVQIGEHPLGKLMQRIAQRYSRYRHKRLRTSGHLFERRYKAKLVDVDAYFLTLLRYIHLNPVKAHMVSDPADYRWSSHCAFLGTEHIEWLTTDFGLSLFSPDLQRARTLYRQFVLDCSDEIDPYSDSHAQDSRILGTDSFIEKLPFVPYKPRSALTLELLASKICQRHGLTVDLLRSRSAARTLTPVRLELLREALDQRVANLTEVSRFLGRDPSTLCKLAGRQQHKIQ